MRKEEFLTTLKKNLSVLEEQEVLDIVAEYEQHIDMKMKDGLSEEDAIADFGDLKELTAGILEAYHVKADFSGEDKKKYFGKDKKAVKDKASVVMDEVYDTIDEAAGALEKAAGTAKVKSTAAGKWIVTQIKEVWQMMKEPFIEFKEKMRQKKEKSKEADKTGLLHKVGMAITGGVGFIWCCILWCIRLLWNLFWLFLGAFAALGALLCVFFIGILVVLLIMGYPVIGVAIGTLGIGLISGAVMLFCLSLLRRKVERMEEIDNEKQEVLKHA